MEVKSPMEVHWVDDNNLVDDDDEPTVPSTGPNKSKLTDIPDHVRDRRNHPALERAQIALKEQSTKKKQDLEDRIYEQGSFLKRATRRREEAGVALYGMQKALATLHMALHKDAEDLASAAEAHHKADEELNKTTQLHKEKSAEMGTLRNKLERTHEELDDLLNSLKQVEKYSQEIKSEIAINRRRTYAAEESMSAAEKHKKDQDLQITLMQKRLKYQYEKQALLRAQLQGLSLCPYSLHTIHSVPFISHERTVQIEKEICPATIGLSHLQRINQREDGLEDMELLSGLSNLIEYQSSVHAIEAFS